jgi:hypothetical protein
MANLTRTRQALIIEPMRPERFFMRSVPLILFYIKDNSQIVIEQICCSYMSSLFLRLHCYILYVNRFFFLKRYLGLILNAWSFSLISACPCILLEYG